MSASPKQGPRPTSGRFRQANKEALITLALYGAYFVWWYAFAYGLGSGDPSAYTYVFGFPAWFFYSCIAGFPLLTITLWIVVRCFFRDMPLDAELPQKDATARESIAQPHGD